MEDATFLETQPSLVAPSPRPMRRTPKLVATLDHQRKITAIGIEPTMEAFVTAIGELAKRATAARRQGVELGTFLAILRDQAKR